MLQGRMGRRANYRLVNLIDQNISHWQRWLGRDLSREDARQIIEKVTGFFAVLAEWSCNETRVPATDTGKPSISDTDEVAMKAEAIAKGSGGGWTARCPAHDDRDGGGE